jgi:hypothetical protein
MSELVIVPPAPDAPHEEHASFWHSVFQKLLSGIATLGKAEVIALIPEPEKAYAVAVVTVAAGAERLLGSETTTDAAPATTAPAVSSPTTPSTPATPVAPVAPTPAPASSPLTISVQTPAAPPEPSSPPPAPTSGVLTQADVDRLVAERASDPAWAGQPIQWFAFQLKQVIGQSYVLRPDGVFEFTSGGGGGITIDSRNAAYNNFPLPGGAS